MGGKGKGAGLQVWDEEEKEEEGPGKNCFMILFRCYRRIKGLICVVVVFFFNVHMYPPKLNSKLFHFLGTELDLGRELGPAGEVFWPSHGLLFKGSSESL